MTRGVLYLASGEEYIQQAKLSAESVKYHNPGVPVTIYSDTNVSEEIFDQTIELDDPITDAGDSILSEDQFPYDNNLYLDTDTYICGDIGCLFDVLENYDMALAHNDDRHRWTEEIYDRIDTDIPDSFPEYNSGVIAYRDRHSVHNLFKSWNKNYAKTGAEVNQPSLRISLYQNDISHISLPPEFNFMSQSVGFVADDVRILHHQGQSVKEIKNIETHINKDLGRRVITFEDYPCRIVPNKKTMRYKVKSIDTERVIFLIKKANKKRLEQGWSKLAAAITEKIRSSLRI